MNTLAEYKSFLVESGLEESQADRVVKIRADKHSPKQVGQIRMEKKEDEAEILLYDVIGFDFWTGEGMTPKKLVEQLEAMQPFSRIMLRVNSPGGDVFDGMTIYNILRRQEAKISVEVEGLAASAASYVTQVADPGELRISEAGMFMVHRAWGITMGNTNDMLEMAGLLEKLDNQIAGIYSSRSKRKVDTWLNLMDEETWLTGQEAVDAKLADETITTKRAAACFDLSQFGYRRAPQKQPPIILSAQLADVTAISGDVAKLPKVSAVDVRLRMIELEGV